MRKKLLFEIVFLMIQVCTEKQKGEIIGVVIVESGWGSILPTVIIANMTHGGPAEKSGKLNIGDQIMSINGTSLVGVPLSTCQSIIKVLRTFLDITCHKTFIGVVGGQKYRTSCCLLTLILCIL